MKKILVLFFVLAGIASKAQYIKMTAYGYFEKRHKDSVLHIPVITDTTDLYTVDTSAQIRIFDGNIYWHYGYWRPFGSGGSSFDSSILRGVYMDTAYQIDDSTTRYCKATTCWDITTHASGGGTVVSFQTNGVDNGSQTLLNLQQGTNITLTDNGTGTVTIDGFDTAGLRGVYMDTVFLVNDTTLRGCKGATCWDLRIGSNLITFEGDTVTINNIKIKNVLKIPLTDTANATKGCGNIIYDTIREAYYGDICLNGAHAYWGCFTCSYVTVTQLNDSTYTLNRQDGTKDTIQFTQGISSAITQITASNNYAETWTITNPTGPTTNLSLVLDTTLLSTRGYVNSKTITINAGTNVTISQAATQNLGTPPVWTINATTSGGSTNSNIGTGYRWAVPNTNNIKTAFAGFAIVIDSTTNTNGLTFKVDTSSTGLHTENYFNTKYLGIYTFSTGLTNTANTITNNLSTGIGSSDQNAYGSTLSGGSLTLNSTTHATKGFVYFGAGHTTAYDGSTGFFGFGTGTPAALVNLSGNITAAAWTTNGIALRTNAATYTDNSSSGTVATQTANVFGAPTFAASSATTYTNASTFYIAGAPVAGTNVTNTNSWAFHIAGGGMLVSAGQASFLGGIYSNTNTANGNINVAGASTHASTTISSALFGGASTVNFRALFNGTNTNAFTTSAAYANVLVASTTNSEASSGTHPVLSNLAVLSPVFNNGTATTTDATSLYIQGAPTGTATITNPATAMWVASGIGRFNGRLEAGQGAAIAAANDLTLGSDGNTFSITGATQINAITSASWQAGSVVSLIFASTPTVKNNTAGGAGTAKLLLSGGVDFTAAANDVLTLLYDGTVWHETARKLTSGSGTAALNATQIGFGSSSNLLTGIDSLTYSSTNRLITTTNSQAGATFVINSSTTIQGQNALILQNTAPATSSVTGLSSPLLLFGANAYKSAITAGSWQSWWAIGSVGITGASSISSALQFYTISGNGQSPSALSWSAQMLSSGAFVAASNVWAGGTAGAGSFMGGTLDATTTSGTSINLIASNSSNSEIVAKFSGQEVLNFYQATGNVSFQNRGTVPADVVDGGQFNIYQNSGMTGISTVSGTSGAAALTGGATKFTKQVQIGDQIAIGGAGAETLTILSITDDTHLTFTANMASSHTNAAYTITPATTRKIIAYNNGNLLAYGDLSIGNAAFNVAGFMTYPAGTTLKAQAVFTAGADLTTGVDGAVNWDGTEFQIWDGTTKEHFLISRAVNTVNPTSPNRTIKVTIGGTDYYIAAKTTNDGIEWWILLSILPTLLTKRHKQFFRI